jgi:hypothetical protein
MPTSAGSCRNLRANEGEVHVADATTTGHVPGQLIGGPGSRSRFGRTMSPSIGDSAASSGTGFRRGMMLFDVAAIGSIDRPRF